MDDPQRPATPRPAEIRPFDASLVPAAAALLVERQRQLRRREVGWPSLDGGTAEASLRELCEHQGATGAAAMRDGALVGFLLGRVEVTPWATVVKAPLPYHALAPREDTETYRDLYAAAARGWVERGAVVHEVQVPASDAAAIDAWSRLSFGHEQVYAVGRPARSGPARGGAAAAGGVTVRCGGAADAPALARLREAIPRRYRDAPVFVPLVEEFLTGLEEGYREALTEPGTRLYLAFRAGVREPVGFALFPPAEPAADLFTPPGSVPLAVLATLPEERGRGVAGAVLTTALADLDREGVVAVTADWRVTNLEADRFFSRRGFLPRVTRMSRRLDPRLAGG